VSQTQLDLLLIYNYYMKCTEEATCRWQRPSSVSLNGVDYTSHRSTTRNPNPTLKSTRFQSSATFLPKLGHFRSRKRSIIRNFSPSFHLLLSYGSSSLYNPEIPVQMTCKREFRASKHCRRPSFRPVTSAPPRWSSRLLGIGGRTGWDNQRSGCNKRRGTPNTPCRRRMSADDNSASESDETWFDDEVQGAGMPISSFSFISLTL
jgi:hypothetical protein